MEIKPTTSNTPASLLFAACPPPAVALGWLLGLPAPSGLEGLEQAAWGLMIVFVASIASLPALVISIQAVRSDDSHRGLATFAAVGNVLVTIQTATLLLATAAYVFS